ncbi:hypothetical protein ABHN98_12495 [Pseudomonas syringae]
MERSQVKYICESMLGIKWVPDLDSNVRDVLASCDSKLEQMYILGACHFIEKASREIAGINSLWISTSSVIFHGIKYTGIWVLEPWHAWYLDEVPHDRRGGPSALLIVPQLRSPEKDITHDLGLFYGDDNGSPKWTFRHAVEIDGYGVHSIRRDADGYRDKGLSYSVLRFQEELGSALTWFKDVVLDDAGMK